MFNTVFVLPHFPARPDRSMADVSTAPLTRRSAEGVRMVDVTDRPHTMRTAVAAGRVFLDEEAFARVRDHDIRKGDVLTVAQIAAVLGAKQTSKLIPLCQDVLLKGVDVTLNLDEEEHAIEVRAFTKTTGPTGVEMEALMAVSIAGLTIYDMCKSVTKDIRISDVRLLAKTGGQSGNYRRDESQDEDEPADVTYADDDA
jgi:molybdenum cofactor biosynthesis protein MoaC